MSATPPPSSSLPSSDAGGNDSDSTARPSQPTTPPTQSAEHAPGRPEGARDALTPLEAVLGHTFARRTLLRDAVTHRSYLNEHHEAGMVSNERLEFLGDAVAGLVSADLLYAEFPHLDEGALTQMRAALVRGTTLAEFARALDLGRYLRVGRSEETAGGRERWLLLASTFEAVVGALYLDGGMAVARRLLEPHLRAELRAIQARSAIKDDKSLLQELAQGQLGITPRYTLIEQSGPAHERTFTAAVMIGEIETARGTGASKRAAEQAAAHAALADQGWLDHDEEDGAGDNGGAGYGGDGGDGSAESGEGDGNDAIDGSGTGEITPRES